MAGILCRPERFFVPPRSGFTLWQGHRTDRGHRMSIITLEPGKRGGRPCIRELRITVYDVLSMLSNGMSEREILEDFPELSAEDIRAVLAYAADREHQVYSFKAS
jgi:uncharacterized protein (DUF433 family)